jgi:divinyl protochlorophyllide a 8-vinyl-reductase
MRAPNAVLAELSDDGAGRLTYRDARYLLIRAETLAALQKAVESALGATAAECLVAGGRAGGGRAAASFTGAGRERAEALVAMGTRIGWGRFALERIAPGELVVTVTGSPFAEAYGTAPGPVCHLIRGVLEALANAVLTGRPQVTETACAATGAPACRFEARV